MEKKQEMESPIVTSLQMDPSILDVENPPSSPFVTEVDTEGRSRGKQWKPDIMNATEDIDLFESPHKPQSQLHDMMEDKENMLQDEPTATLKRVFASPQKPVTPERVPTKSRTPEPRSVRNEGHRRSRDLSGMPPPPPSMREEHNMPRRTPLKQIHNTITTATPHTLGGGNSYEHDVSRQIPSTIQAEFDTRKSIMPHSDTSVDDTCFSTFSEIPDMTLFAKLGQSPTKYGDMLRTPGRNTAATPRTSQKRSSQPRSPSPTPRRQKTSGMQNKDGTTNFLIDFTQQIESVGSHYEHSPNKPATESNLLQYINSQRSPNKARHSYVTPSKPNNILSLLDFELPPPPTPRSVPTITVRELESLKSSYLSQISSLKATLSGREAEVESLKRAVGDAERRAGEAQEALREEKCKLEHVEKEKADWEKRGQEVDNVLKNVKEEVLKSEAEKEDLIRKLEENERHVEDAEARAVKAEERFADALAARAETGNGDTNAIEEQSQRLFNVQIDAKIEQVSRELHAVYKEKHERKVATLKKSYEARNEKKCADLQARLADLERQNDELLAAKDATLSGPIPNAGTDAELKTQLEEHKAALSRLEHEMDASRQQQDQLMHELKQERIEKGDLVAAVDEMLALQAETGSTQSAVGVVEGFRKSISKPSGLRVPGTAGASRIGGPAGLNRSMSGNGKSRMLANIERMGRQGGGAGPALE